MQSYHVPTASTQSPRIMRMIARSGKSAITWFLWQPVIWGERGETAEFPARFQSSRILRASASRSTKMIRGYDPEHRTHAADLRQIAHSLGSQSQRDLVSPVSAIGRCKSLQHLRIRLPIRADVQLAFQQLGNIVVSRGNLVKFWLALQRLFDRRLFNDCKFAGLLRSR